MSKDHGMSEFKEEVIVPKKREEAKNRYEKFQQLASSGLYILSNNLVDLVKTDLYNFVQSIVSF